MGSSSSIFCNHGNRYWSSICLTEGSAVWKRCVISATDGARRDYKHFSTRHCHKKWKAVSVFAIDTDEHSSWSYAESNDYRNGCKFADNCRRLHPQTYNNYQDAYSFIHGDGEVVANSPEKMGMVSSGCSLASVSDRHSCERLYGPDNNIASSAFLSSGSLLCHKMAPPPSSSWSTQLTSSRKKRL